MNKKIISWIMIGVFALSIVCAPATDAYAKKRVPVKKIKITSPKKKTIKMKTGSKYRLKVKVLPGNATNKKLRYKSGKPKVASVTAKGVIRAKKKGSTKITVKTTDGSKKKKVIKVKVIKNSGDTAKTNDFSGNINSSINDNNSVAEPETGSPSPTELPDGIFTIASGKNAVKLYIDYDSDDYEGLELVSKSFADDVRRVSDTDIDIVTDEKELSGSVIIAGSIGKNKLIDKLIDAGKLKTDDIKGKWEVYKTDVIENPFEGVEKALVIAGSDKRGTIYGLYRISEMMGVSPWVYWADINPAHKDTVSFKYSELRTTSKEPSVKYRGIFLNDEEPSLGTWVNNKFKTSSGGKFNEKFYEHVFQLLLRLKANYMWPAMWNSSFGADGADFPEASAELANKYGIVMGTSHHEPMMLAHQDWVRNKSKYGNREWDWITNSEGLTEFFTYGAKNFGKYDNIATIGMRGDGDATMLPEGSTVEENVSLLKEIITAQKRILSENNLDDKPTMIALYKEVEEYWYGDDETEGLKEWEGLDDTIALLAEDNYGNLRTLPNEADRNRPGGWGMYYHFDYNGAPASYQWTQTFQLQKVWEQMSMAYDYGVKDIWIVNVGDLKPMEMPISFFLDMAYDFDTWGTVNTDSTSEYEDIWLKEQFGSYLNDDEIDEISEIIDDYTRVTTLRKPEIVTGTTFSLENYNEAVDVLDTIESIYTRAEKYRNILPDEAQAAYYQLVYYPAVATTNVIKMQIYSGLNKAFAKSGVASANIYAKLLDDAIAFDKELEYTYDKDMPGGVGDKWDGMMAQATNARHVGYESWRPEGAYPVPEYINLSEQSSMYVNVKGETKVYQNGNIKLSEFTNINDESIDINIINGGTKAFDYTAATDSDWIKLTKESGTVTEQDTIGISVDFDKVKSDKTGTVTINGNSQTVTLSVSAVVIDTSGFEKMTYVEAHDYISIEAAHYSDAVCGENGAEWKEIKDYGRTLSSMKVYPTTQTFEDEYTAPYLEYKIYVDNSEQYTLQTHIAPSNNVDWDNVTMKFGISVDDGDIMLTDTITSSYVAGTWRDSTWSNAVRNNIRTVNKSLGNLSEGVHTIRIYAIDPAVVIEKLIVYPDSKGLKNSYLGPKESYYAH